MSNLDYAFLNFILDKRPTFRKLSNLKKEIVIKDKNVQDVVDYLTYVLASKWEEEMIPKKDTLIELLDQSEEVALSKWLSSSFGLYDWTNYGSDMSDFILAFSERDYKDKYNKLKEEVVEGIGKDDKNIEDKVTKLYRLFDSKKHKSIAPTPISSLVDKDRLFRGETMYPTHIPDLNEALGGDRHKGGIAAGEVTIIGGYTNAGKSICSQSLFSHYLTLGVPIVYFNIEVRQDLFISQLFSQITGEWLYQNKSSQFLNPAWEHYENFLRSREDRFVLYNQDGPRSVASLESEIEKYASDGYEIFFLDTINSLMGHGERKDLFTEVMITLESLAKRYNIAIVATAQMKQSLMFGDDKRPNLWDIGEGVAIQQKAGTVIGIYRSDKYGESTAQGIMGQCDYTSLMMLKLRNRSAEHGEFVRVSYDNTYKMYSPYTGMVSKLAETDEEIVSQLGLDF